MYNDLLNMNSFIIELINKQLMHSFIYSFTHFNIN